MKNILLIDDDRNILSTLEIHLENLGFRVIKADTGRDGIRLCEKEKPGLVFLDLKLPDMDGLSVLEEILALGLKTDVVVVTAYAAIDTAVSAIKTGAFDYLPKPFTPAQITQMIERVKRVQSMQAEIDQLKGIVREGDFITRNRQVRKILTMARQVADSSASLIIGGESGTGKGLLAHCIHDWSPRAGGPFITVDCAALQENLLESDLFGHVKGAFTGAMKDKPGKLELADRGTVFLDEISEMSTATQAKFLRFLQDREFERLGDPNPISVDVRVIAASNRDLEELVRDKIFRQDLYFRLNVVEIFLPPLRDRPEDIAILAEYYLDRFAKINKKNLKGFDEQALELLHAYPWPGNIRELVNVIERGTILSRGARMNVADLPPSVINYAARNDSDQDLKTIAEIEKEHIRNVLIKAPTLEEAARILGIDPATLWRKRKRYQLE